MKETKLIIQKIPKCFVGKDCVQIMIPFTNSIRVYEKDTMLLEDIKCRYFLDASYNALNTYIDDERKNKFPYSNIPLHCTRDYRGKVYYVNQLFDFDIDYWCLIDENLIYTDSFMDSYYAGYLIHKYLIRDNDEVLIVSEYYSMDIYGKYNDIKDYDTKRKYTLEEIKGFSPARIKKAKNPRINFSLNPDINKEEIKQAKRLVRSMNKK